MAPLSEYWRHQACWYTWVWNKERRGYGFIYTSVHQRDLGKKFLYKGMEKVSPLGQRSMSLYHFKHNFRRLNGWIHPRYIVLFMYAYIMPYLNANILSILFTASPIYSYPELTSILSWYCCFLCMIYNSPHPGFQIFQSICATPNFKSWIRPWLHICVILPYLLTWNIQTN